MLTTASRAALRYSSVKRSTTHLRASGHWSRGVMSRKRMPGCGKSGTSRMKRLRSRPEAMVSIKRLEYSRNGGRGIRIRCKEQECRMPDAADLKQRAIADIDARRDELIDLSLRIHSTPEIAFEEEKSSAMLVEYLEANGFQVERG